MILSGYSITRYRSLQVFTGLYRSLQVFTGLYGLIAISENTNTGIPAVAEIFRLARP